MPLFRRRNEYDRKRLLEAATLASGQNRRRRAIALYRRVLAVECNNADLHSKLAPLLAETGQAFDAWNSFRSTASAALREGRDYRALAVYREASRHLPREIQVWQALAGLLGKRGEAQAAVEALLEGSRHFRTPSLRPQAIHLLRRARTIDPWQLESVIELAGLLGRSQQREEARILLDGLVQRSVGRNMRQVRAAQLRLDPQLQTAWRYLRSCMQSASDVRPDRTSLAA